jgi:adenylate kinase family enzyme
MLRIKDALCRAGIAVIGFPQPITTAQAAHRDRPSDWPIGKMVADTAPWKRYKRRWVADLLSLPVMCIMD